MRFEDDFDASLISLKNCLLIAHYIIAVFLICNSNCNATYNIYLEIVLLFMLRDLPLNLEEFVKIC